MKKIISNDIGGFGSGDAAAFDTLDQIKQLMAEAASLPGIETESSVLWSFLHRIQVILMEHEAKSCSKPMMGHPNIP